MLNQYLYDIEIKYNIDRTMVLIMLCSTIKKELNLKNDVYLEYDENKKILFFESAPNNLERRFRITKNRITSVKKQLEREIINYQIQSQKDYFKNIDRVVLGEIFDRYKGGFEVRTCYGVCKLPYNLISANTIQTMRNLFHRKMYFYIHKINTINKIKNEIFLTTENDKIIHFVISKHLDKSYKYKIVKADNKVILYFIKDFPNIDKQNLIRLDLQNHKLIFKRDFKSKKGKK